MKLSRIIGWFAVLVPASLILLIIYAIFFQTPVARYRYKSKWIARFSAYHGAGEVPAEWKDDVALRTWPSGEWVLAAMHHGSCAPGPEGSFNASVILDSTGAIYFQDWSPCASGVHDEVKFWEGVLEPELKLADLHANRTQWLRAEP